MKFATKPIWHRPPHLRHVATIPWGNKEFKFLQIFSQYGGKCKHIAFASNFVVRPQILIFSVLKNGMSFPMPIANNFLCHCSFGYLLLRSICGIQNSSQQMSLQRLSMINMVFSDKDKILIRSLYLKGYTAKRLTGEFPEKRWTKCGVNKLLKTLQDTGTVYTRPEFWIFYFPR